MVTQLKVSKMPAIAKRDESFTVYEYDNGFMLEIGGRNKDEDWSNAKIMCNTVDDLVTLIKEATSMPKD